MQFRSTFKRYKANVHKNLNSFTTSCFKKQLFPKPLLKYFFGTSFVLKSYQLNTGYLHALKPVFQSKKSFELIQLMDNQLEDQHICDLFLMLSERDIHVKNLWIGDQNQIGCLAVRVLAESSLLSQHLVYLNFSGCKISDRALHELFDAMSSVKRMFVEYLLVSNVRMSEAGLGQLIDFLPSAYKLIFLDISYN